MHALLGCEGDKDRLVDEGRVYHEDRFDRFQVVLFDRCEQSLATAINRMSGKEKTQYADFLVLDGMKNRRVISLLFEWL